jgi:hypothetical protein
MRLETSEQARRGVPLSMPHHAVDVMQAGRAKPRIVFDYAVAGLAHAATLSSIDLFLPPFRIIIINLMKSKPCFFKILSIDVLFFGE